MRKLFAFAALLALAACSSPTDVADTCDPTVQECFGQPTSGS